VSIDSVIKFTSGFIRASNGISKSPSNHKRATMTHGVPFNALDGPYSLHGTVSVHTVCSGKFSSMASIAPLCQYNDMTVLVLLYYLYFIILYIFLF